MEIEEELHLYKELTAQIEELEKKKKELSASIMAKMTKKTLHLPHYIVKCISRLSIKTSLEEARRMEAVKMQEVIDKDKIKALYQSGQPVQGVSELYYIQVSANSSSQA